MKGKHTHLRCTTIHHVEQWGTFEKEALPSCDARGSGLVPAVWLQLRGLAHSTPKPFSLPFNCRRAVLPGLHSLELLAGADGFTGACHAAPPRHVWRPSAGAILLLASLRRARVQSSGFADWRLAHSDHCLL